MNFNDFIDIDKNVTMEKIRDIQEIATKIKDDANVEESDHKESVKTHPQTFTKAKVALEYLHHYILYILMYLALDFLVSRNLKNVF